MPQQIFKIYLVFCIKVFLPIILITVFLLITIPTTQADTIVGGSIISDTIWMADNSPYIITENVVVEEGVTLTIEAGVTIKFEKGTMLQVNGGLIVQGTTDNLITFTSNQFEPEAGDWNNIEFAHTAITTTMDTEGNYVSGSILQHCVVEYGGGNYMSGTIIAHSLLIDYCTIRNNNARGIYNTGTEDSPAKITNSIIISNLTYYPGPGTGAGIYTVEGIISNNTVSHNLVYGRYSGSGGGIYASDSILRGNIVSDNGVSLGHYSGDGGGVYAERSILEHNIIKDNVASAGVDASGGGIRVSDSTVISNTVSENSAYAYGNVSGGGIYASNSTVKNNTISSNRITGKVYLSGGGIYASDSAVINNMIMSNFLTGNNYNNGQGQGYGGGVFVSDSSLLSNAILTNTIVADNPQGSGTYISGSGDFLCNTLFGNAGPITQTVGGLEINGRPYVHYNNFTNNSPYDVTIVSPDDIFGQHNYWETTSHPDIQSRIYDWYDDSGRGRLIYEPLAIELNTECVVVYLPLILR